MKERSYKHCCLVAHLCPILQPHGLQQARLPCPSPSPRDCSNSCPLSRWCHPIISSSVIPYSSCPKTCPASESFSTESAFCIRWPKYWHFIFSISPPMNIQDWFPLELNGLISMLSKGLSRVFSSTIVQKHQFLDIHTQETRIERDVYANVLRSTAYNS